jgi:HEAT repeat protein
MTRLYRILPVDLHAALACLAVDLDDQAIPSSANLDTALAGMARLPANAVSTAAYEIRDAARMTWWTTPRPFLLRLVTQRQTPVTLMAREPRFAWLFLFHGDGRVRQAALERLESPPTSPFLLAALALRLNDWVPEVRAAAKITAARLLPATSPDIIASVAMDLLDREFHWSRWTDEVVPLNTAFARSDVVAVLAEIFLRSPNGPLANRLRYVLRYPAYDVWLPLLALEAIQPSVRATALGCLIAKRVSWPVGFEWKWIDKAYGERRRVMALGSRSIEPAQSPEQLIVQGLHDPSPVVRRVAADALIEYRGQMSGVGELIIRLASDRSPSLRERADYMIRHPLEA